MDNSDNEDIADLQSFDKEYWDILFLEEVTKELEDGKLGKYNVQELMRLKARLRSKIELREQKQKEAMEKQEKAAKKKLKKLKQKERKRNEKLSAQNNEQEADDKAAKEHVEKDLEVSEQTSETDDTRKEQIDDKSEPKEVTPEKNTLHSDKSSETTNENCKIEITEENDTDNSPNTSTDDSPNINTDDLHNASRDDLHNASTDDLDLSDEIPAFINNTLKKLNLKPSDVKNDRKKKTNAGTTEVAACEIPLDTLKVTDKDSVKDDTSSSFYDDFTVITNKHDKLKLSESCANEAVKLLLKNEVVRAVKYLSEAIPHDPHDVRHYINRSFGYLRLKKFDLAMADAQYALNHASNPIILAKANYLAAQASYWMQNYQEAEKYLEESLKLSPRNMYVKRELIKVKVAQLVTLGFNERDALNALRDCVTVADAVELLCERTNNSNMNNKDNMDHYSFDDDIYYHSSDESEIPSNAKLLTSMMEEQLGSVNQRQTSSSNTGASQTTIIINTNVKKAQTASSKTKGNTGVNNQAIWVGNLTPQITTKQLQDYFSRFGSVATIYRPINNSYCFVNFSNEAAASKALAAKNCEIDGKKLQIKQARKNS